MQIDRSHAETVCKIGCGEETCAYLAVARGGGLECLKGTDRQAEADARRATGNLRRLGDHCPGRTHQLAATAA